MLLKIFWWSSSLELNQVRTAYKAVALTGELEEDKIGGRIRHTFKTKAAAKVLPNI